ncbi:MAG: hypothetical protein KKH85_07960, partial [Proteobacteria bacterium]|nr:hypothetical protein [Pseudomonadota bacterium]
SIRKQISMQPEQMTTKKPSSAFISLSFCFAAPITDSHIHDGLVKSRNSDGKVKSSLCKARES